MIRVVVVAALLAFVAGGRAGGERPLAVGAAPPVARAAVATADRSAVPAASPIAVAYVAPVPLPLRVLRPFDPPATRYGPGHLGVDLGVAAQQIVRSAGPGVVRFAGPVAGRGVVVVAHPDGISTEYEPVRPSVPVGRPVRAGDAIGHLAGVHAGCPAVACLHWGARRGGTYVDPLSLLRRLGPVRLLPWPGA